MSGRIDVLGNACPRCDAPAGSVCIDLRYASGRVRLPSGHRERLAVAVANAKLNRLVVGNVIYVRFPLKKKRKAIPEAVRRAVVRRDGGPDWLAPCHYCGVWQSTPGAGGWGKPKRLEFDHVIPVELGGSNHVDNIVLACQRCNRSKGWRRTAEEMAWRTS